MPTKLEQAQQYARDGQVRKAVDALWEVPLSDASSPDEVRALLDLAQTLHDRTDGRLKSDCEFQMHRAQEVLDGSKGAPEMQAPDPLLLARRAFELGLAWLEIESATDLVAGPQLAGLASGTPVPCQLDAIEAEGWKLENVQQLFIPTAVQSSPLRGAEFVMGGQPIDGQRSYVYVFRRAERGVV